MVTPLRTILTTITKKLKLEPAAHLARAQEVWPVIAGPVVAAASTPVGLRGKRLSVGVTNPTIGQEIKLRHAELIRALAKELGSDIVTVVVSVHRRSLEAPGRHVRRRS